MTVLTKYLFALVLCAAGGVADAQNVHGVLRVVKGDVQIKASKNGQVTKARIGEKVYPKDVIITAKDSRAKIVMVDRNEINVSPESQVEIQNYEFNPDQGKKDVLLNVIYGKVRSKVEQKYDGKTTKFQIRTPSAVAGVRGTDFLISFNQANRQSQVVTFEGKVEFGVPGPGGTIANPVYVEPGKVASVGSGQSAPTPPKEMPKEDLAKMEQETKPDSSRAGGDNGKNDPRAPAGDGKDEKKDKQERNSDGGDKAKSDNNGGRQPAGATGGSSSGGNTPAGDSMFRPEDFAAGDSGSIPSGPALPGMIQPLPIGQLPACDFCTRVIEHNSTKLIIRVNAQ
jgi:hypothetical protein